MSVCTLLLENLPHTMGFENSEPRHKRQKMLHEDVVMNNADIDLDNYTLAMAMTERDVATTEKDWTICKRNYELPDEHASTKKHINDLPDEVLAKILGYLPYHDRVRNASAVCWRWHEAAFDQDNWKEIDVCIGDKMNIEDLIRLVKSSTKILRVTLHELLLDETFTNVLEKCSTLHTLILNVKKYDQDSSHTDLVAKSGSPRASSRLALTSIGQHCGENLQKIVLYQLDGLNDRILLSILRSCNKLDILIIAHCKNLSTSVLSAIGKNASQLTQVIVRCPKDKRLSDRSLKKLVDCCPMLQVLDIYANFSVRTDWICLGKLKHLRVLAITTIDISVNSGLIEDDTIIYWMTECKHLKFLSVYSPLMTDKALEVIALSKLTRVDMLISSGITPQGLELLAMSTTLEKICMLVHHDAITVDGHGIVKLAQNLTTLEAMSILVGHSDHPLYKQMEEISSVWKGVYPISVKSLQ